MRWKRRGHTQSPTVGMGDVDRAGMQMQAVLDRAPAACIGASIFAVAEDGLSKAREMSPELVRAACYRLCRDPGELLAAMAENSIVRNRAAGAVVILFFYRRHALVAPARAEAGLLRERELDRASLLLRHA